MGRAKLDLKIKKRGDVFYWYDRDQKTGKVVTFGRARGPDDKPSPEVCQQWAAWLLRDDETRKFNREVGTYFLRQAQAYEPFDDEAGKDKPTPAKPVKASKGQPGLKDAIKIWTDSREKTGALTDDHIVQTGCVWKNFISRLGNVPLAELTRAHFVEWRDYITATRRGKSGSWYNKRTRNIKLVFNWLASEKPEILPVGIKDYLAVLKNVTEDPKPLNAEPMPADIFKRLLQAAEPGAEKALLYLTANCGLDCGDIRHLKWENLCLVGKAPHFNMVRHKVLWKVRNAKSVQRIIPLAAETVAELKRIEAKRDPEVPYVFARHYVAWTKKVVVGLINRLKEAAGLTGSPWSYKHLRNVGPNLADELDLPLQRIDGFLGHCIPTMASRYMRAEKSASQFQELVDEIAKRYFQPPTKKG